MARRSRRDEGTCLILKYNEFENQVSINEAVLGINGREVSSSSAPISLATLSECQKRIDLIAGSNPGGSD